MDNDPEIAKLKVETVNKYIEIKIDALISKLNSTMDFLQSILLSKDITDLYNDENKNICIDNEELNWKYKVYTGLHSNKSIRFSISNSELDELMKFIAVYFSAKRKYLLDYTLPIETIIRNKYKRLIKLTNPYYSAITSKSREQSENNDYIHELNMDLLQRDEIENLHTMLDLMCKYTYYS